MLRAPADSSHRDPLDPRRRGASASRATNRSRTAMPCWPRSPTANPSIGGYSPGADCAATLACLRALGVAIRTTGPAALDDRRDAGSAASGPPPAPLDAVNSGHDAAPHVRHPGRPSVSRRSSAATTRCQRRPMRRIIEPLTRMGARIESINGRPPLTIHGGSLHAITHEPAVPSAQVKSGVLLAGLHATGTTRVIEHVPTRDHTERALRGVRRRGGPGRRRDRRRGRPAAPAADA